MFERFTARARRVLVLAQEEAAGLGHGFIGTEHILLGLLEEGEGVGAIALTQVGVQLEAARAAVLAVVPAVSTSGEPGKPPFTPRAKKVLELSLREALQLGHNYIGTEHLLLGLIRGEGVAAEVLAGLGADAGAIRAKVVELLSGYTKDTKATPAARDVTVAAQARAAGDPTGSHHLLVGLLDTPDSLGAKVLASFGLTLEAAQARIAEMGVAGTSDELPKRKRKRAVALAPGITLTVDDETLARADDHDEMGDTPADAQLSPDDLVRVIEILKDHLAQALDTDPPDPPDA